MAYLGVNDMRAVTAQVRAGDERARRIYQGMAYQVSKEIAALGAVLQGKVDLIVLTGGVAHDSSFVEWIEARCSFLAPVIVYPGEEEMEALALGALRVLRNEESARSYSKLKAESYRRMVKT
jgi:butyrate kinase